MPVFLERHDFFKVTAADIARIHLEDIRIQQEFGCWVLAYWFDQKRKTTFCLVDAPDLESVKEMHCHVHHSSPNEIIQVEEDLIEYFLNSIEFPKSFETKSPYLKKPKFCFIMVMKFYCSDPISKEYNNRNKIIEDFQNCSQKFIKKNKGRIVNSACDGCIYSFDSVSRSINSALQIQKEFGVISNKNRGKSLNLSIGIDGGRPIIGDGDFFDKTTTLALRLCCIAGRNQIVISSKVKEQFQFYDRGILAEKDNIKALNQNDEQFLNRLMDIIELHYREDFKIGNFCKLMGESRSQLYRKIIDVTNFSPISLVNEFRLKKATELMNTQNGNNISQIAFEAGFNSLSYFSRRFKKRFGLHPSAYMNRT